MRGVVAVVLVAGAVGGCGGGQPDGRGSVAVVDTVPTTVDVPDTVPVPTTVPTTVATTVPVTTTSTARVGAKPPAPPAPSTAGPKLPGEWTLRAPLEPDATYGPKVRGEVGARRVEGTAHRWVGSAVFTGMAPNAEGHLLIVHSSEAHPQPFASTACTFKTDSRGNGTCTGEFDTFEYTSDPGREIKNASLMGPTGNAVAYAYYP